jgi:hypothetical protein
VTIPDGGFVYLNIHLDFGLKGNGGFSKVGKDAYDCAGVNLLIPDGNPFKFCETGTSGGDSKSSCDTVTNANDFKKNPGSPGQAGVAAQIEKIVGSALKKAARNPFP